MKSWQRLRGDPPDLSWMGGKGTWPWSNQLDEDPTEKGKWPWCGSPLVTSLDSSSRPRGWDLKSVAVFCLQEYLGRSFLGGLEIDRRADFVWGSSWWPCWNFLRFPSVPWWSHTAFCPFLLYLLSDSLKFMANTMQFCPSLLLGIHLKVWYILVLFNFILCFEYVKLCDWKGKNKNTKQTNKNKSTVRKFRCPTWKRESREKELF